MQISDINVVNFYPYEIEDAREWAKFMDSKNEGQKTVDLTNTKNMTGYLCHLAVEKVMRELNLPFTSTRTEKFKQGDTYDIEYEGDLIDVKGEKRAFDSKWFFNQEMWVADWHQVKNETHYCFVWHELDFETAYIFGVIGAQEFWENAGHGSFTSKKTGELVKYHYVRSRTLKPLRNYLLRV